MNAAPKTNDILFEDYLALEELADEKRKQSYFD
jgi:hypothetical protein